MNFTSYQVQQYVRIALYWLFGALGTYGVAVPDNSKALIVSVIGTVANLAWTMWGTRLNALIGQIATSPDVKKIVVADPAMEAAVPSAKVVSGNAP